MSFSLQLEVLSTPLDRTHADLLLAGFFVSDRPLRDSNGKADYGAAKAVTEAGAPEAVTA